MERAYSLRGAVRNQGNTDSSISPVINLHAANFFDRKESTFLATARVMVLGSKANTWVRALLDQGSEASLISESIMQLLGLSKRRTYMSLFQVDTSAYAIIHSKMQIRLNS